MAKIYQYGEKNFPYAVFSNYYVRQSTQSGVIVYQLTYRSGNSFPYYSVPAHTRRIIIRGNSGAYGVFYGTGATPSASQYVYKIAATSSSVVSGKTEYIIDMPDIAQDFFVSLCNSSTNTVPSESAKTPVQWNEVNIEKRTSGSWGVGNIYQYSFSMSYRTTGIQMSGTYISAVGDAYLTYRAGRIWDDTSSGQTYSVKLKGDWTTINGNGWDFYSCFTATAGQTGYATTKSNIVYDSVTDTTTLDVTLNTGSILIFAHPTTNVTNSQDVLNSINPQVLKSTGTWD